MAKVFDREKFEQIKTKVEVVRAANTAANDDRHFYREVYQKQAAWFKHTYNYHNRLYDTVHNAIDALARTEANYGIPYFQAEFKKTLELLTDEPRAKNHLEELFVSLLEFKNAERRSSEAYANLINVAGCFDVLEDFARKHISRHPNRNISALPNTAFSGGFSNV